MNNPFSLSGKNAWITGGSYGIGFNIAKAFVAAGIKNIIFNDINEAALQRGLDNTNCWLKGRTKKPWPF